MKRLFGTDGIRGEAGVEPLDAATVRRVAVAVAEVLRPAESDGPLRLVIGRDTRESGPWLRDALAAGCRSRGAEVVDCGVVTTPGLAHIVREAGFNAGVMISASHNPFQDNGLKIFGGDGSKLADALEMRIEALVIDDGIADPGADGAEVDYDGDLVDSYVRSLENVITPGRFEGVEVVLDCSNGSATVIGPEVFRHHGARVHAIGTSPDGRNINLDCGSLHLDKLIDEVRRTGSDLGLAFDGDADRCLAVDREGREVSGDHVLYIVGRQLKRSGRLRGDAIVATIMSNLWLEDRLRDEGVELHRASVGDKYVLERMVAEDLVLGGEQSGHVIFRDHATTGDGVLTGLLLLDTLVANGEPLESIMRDITPYPQVLLNVRVNEKPNLREHAKIGPVVESIEGQLRGTGRVVLRYSGTEPVARVMLEGKNADDVRTHAEHLAAVIRSELGA
ncbi:MAG: phosphoglucosamine mutase [bacterium]|nr:phosphoglucosamine mutase [bacterium]